MTDIPITANERKAQFTGNTGLGPFAFTFNILANSDIRVIKNSTVLTLTSEYTVTTNVDGTGSVTLTGSGNGTALISSDVLTIIGNRQLARTSDYVQGGNLFAEALNEDLDSIVIMMQQLDEKVSRTMRIDAGDIGQDLLLPSKASRLNRVLQFNATTGDPEAGPTADAVANAQTNATNAASSATAAASSASAAATSATAAAGSATAAASSATAAAASATAAAASETAAETAETNAETAKTAAETAATTAQGAASSATTSANAASTSASSASSSASAAATSASNAATSETNAANSATAAASSATSAANSAAAAASSFDSFDDRYLGVKASDPTLDNDGNALVSGALYFSSSENIMKVYDGASWIAATSAGNVSFLQYEYTATAGQTTFSGADDNTATLSYTVSNLIVTLNGVVLDNGGDYTATNGTSVVLTSGAAAGDLLQVIAFKSFTVADMVPASTGGTFAGNVAVNGNLTVDTNTLFVDAANNLVGVGTSSPEGNLHVLNSSAGTVTAPANFPLVLEGTTVAGMSVLTSNTGEGRIWFGDPDDNDVGRIEYAHSTNAMTFRTNASDRMVIDSSGDVCIGTTAPSYGEKLIVVNAGVGQNCAFFLFNSTDDRANLILQHQGSSGGTARTNIQFHNSSASGVGSITTTGTGVAYNTTSDYRLKENVVPLAGAADRLAQIPVHRFNFIADPDRTVDGFLAHEVQEFVPECVTGTKDQVETVEVTDEDGNVTTETRPVYQGIDQSKLVPLLTAALQEALADIATLKAEVAALKGEPA